MINYLNLFLTAPVIIGLIALLTGNYIILFLSILIILSIKFLQSWNKHIFDKLIVKRYFSQQAIQVGQELEYIVELENRKFLPILAIKLVSSVSTDLQFISEKANYYRSGLNVRLRDIFSLKWYEKVRRRYQIIPQKRGVQGVFSTKLEYLDPLNFFENSLEDGLRVKLFVYPRILPLAVSKSSYSMLFGSRASQGWIYQDKMNKIGVRPYQYTDSFRQINWKATASRLELQSDIYKPSLDQELHIFHGLQNKEKWWEKNDANILELSLVCAASLCENYFRRNYKVGFYSTMYRINQSQQNYTAIGGSTNIRQRAIIYKTMAMLKNNGINSLAKIIKREKVKMKTGATLLIICDRADTVLRKLLNHLKNSYNIILITIMHQESSGPFFNGNMMGIKQLYLREGDWHEIKEIRLFN